MCKFLRGSSAVAMVILMILGCVRSNNSSDTEAATDDAWTSVATFTVSGDIGIIMDMPNAGRVDGVVAVIMVADKPTDV